MRLNNDDLVIITDSWWRGLLAAIVLRLVEFEVAAPSTQQKK